MGGPRVSDDEYWKRLIRADVIFTTACHAMESGSDDVDAPHLVYRYTEALAAGTALVAPLIKEAAQLYQPNIHYAAYSDEQEAVELLAQLLEQPGRRSELAEAGRKRVREISSTANVWALVDQILGKQAPRDRPSRFSRLSS